MTGAAALLWNSVLYSLRHPAIKAGIIATLICTAAALVIIVGFWRPVHRETQALADAVEAKRKETVNALYSAEIAKAYAATAKRIDTLENKLNLVNPQAALVSHLGALARKHQIKILAESYEEGKELEGYKPLHLELAMQGGYSSVRHFLQDLKTLPTLSSLQEAGLSAQERAGEIKAHLRLVTYYKSTTVKADGR